MPTFMNFVFRLFLLAAGLVFAASLAVGAVLLLALWAVRAGWARLTGRPVKPFVFRINPRAGFGRMYRTSPRGSATPRADAVRPGRGAGDVTDVQVK